MKSRASRVISEIVKRELHLATQCQFYYFMTYNQVEIDLILVNNTTKTFIEIKKSATFNPKMIRALIDYTPTDAKRILLYNGADCQHRGVDILSFEKYL